MLLVADPPLFVISHLTNHCRVYPGFHNQCSQKSRAPGSPALKPKDGTGLLVPSENFKEYSYEPPLHGGLHIPIPTIIEIALLRRTRLVD